MCELIPIPNEFDDTNDFWPHPVYDIGCLNYSGYLQIGVINHGIKKNYGKHRFIFECLHGKINDVKLVVDHINNIKIDNRLENLQLITESQNMKKEHRKGENLPSIRVQAININSEESFDYDSISKCGKGLDINPASIRFVLNGIQKTATSKLDKNKYYFKKIRIMNAIKHFDIASQSLFVFSLYIHLFCVWQLFVG